MNDFRFAIRSLLKSPGFAAATIVTLAIAIGANTAMFSFLYGVVLQPLPFPNAERVVRVWETDRHNSSFREGASNPDLEDWKKQQTVFTGLAGMNRNAMNLTASNADAERITVLGVSGNYFDVLGVKPLDGRTFVANDDRNGTSPVAIISDALAQRRFGTVKASGRTVALDGRSFEVVGVVPESISVSSGTFDAWIPLTIALYPFTDVRGAHSVSVIGRLKDGVSLARAQNEMDVIAARLARQYPDDNVGRGANVEPVLDALVSDSRPRLFILSAAVAAVLLIACINIAGLMLARGDARGREIAIRASLGASRGRIVRQLLSESLLIALIGGTFGIALAWWGTKALLAIAPDLPRDQSIHVNLPVLLFAAGGALLSAVLFGVIPAIRSSSVRPSSALGTARGVLRGARSAGRGVLVVTEMALAVILVIGAGVLLKSFAKLMAVDVGMKTGQVVTFSMSIPEAKYPTPARDKYPAWPEMISLQQRMLERMENVPGVNGVALGMNHPLEAGFTSQFDIAGRPEQKGPRDEVRIRPVTPGYFNVLGIPMTAGRGFQADDRNGGPAVAIINDAFVRQYFANENPIGKVIKHWGAEREVVGVTKGERFGGPASAPEPTLYMPFAQLPMSSLTLITRTTAAPESVISSVRSAMKEMDPDIAMYDVETLDASLGSTLATPRFQAVLITSFGAIALLLAAIGLYALIAYQVQQRTNEIGIRLALGATRTEVAGLIAKRVALLTLPGIVLGLAGALATSRFLRAIVFQVNVSDPVIYAVVPLILACVAALASWLPARRAMRVDPAVALRYE